MVRPSRGAQCVRAPTRSKLRCVATTRLERARLANAREVAALRERAIKIAGVEAERVRAGTDLDAADEAIRSLDREIAALMPCRPPLGRDPLSFLDAWRTSREAAMEIVGALDELKDAARRANDDAEQARRSLCEAMRVVGVAHAPDGALGSLVEAAELALAEAAKADAQRQKMKERRVEAGRAEARLKAALDDDGRWRAAWRGACAGSWLGEAEPEPPLNAVRQALKALEELRVCAEGRRRTRAPHRSDGARQAPVRGGGRRCRRHAWPRRSRRARRARRRHRGPRGAGPRERTPPPREDRGAGDGAPQACRRWRGARG